MRAVDTNVVVRFLTRDDPAQASRAKAVIEAGDVFVGTTVLLETEWVLRSVYGFAREDVARALGALAGLPGVSVESPVLFGEALQRTESGMDFADALHLALRGDARVRPPFYRSRTPGVCPGSGTLRFPGEPHHRRLQNALRGQRIDHLRDHLVGQGAHLVVRPVLDGVPDEAALRVVHAECLRLGAGRVTELARGDRNRRDALDLEPYRVMQTARGTGASVGQRFDDEVVVLPDVLAQLRRRGLGERRLGVAVDLDARQRLRQQ